MVIVTEMSPHEYNSLLAAALKDVEEFSAPEWAAFVKSSVHKERPPVEEDFWVLRSASILRQLYVQGVVGVQRLRTRYGGVRIKAK